MSLTDPNSKTRLMGFNIPNLLLYGLIAFAIILMVKIGGVISSTITTLMQSLGLATDKDTDENKKVIKDQLLKDPAVASQLTVGTRSTADLLEGYMQGFGYNIDAIYDIYRNITGPSQMKALYAAFGTRTISTGLPILGTIKGDLITCVQARLWGFQYNKTLKVIGVNKTPMSIKRVHLWVTQSK